MAGTFPRLPKGERMSHPQPALIARDVHKSFGSGASRVPVLRGVSLEVRRGEIVFLVGPSGSGKTTLLSLLGCLLRPDQGHVWVLDREVSKLRPRQLTALRREHFGFIFQTFNLFPTLSALDNVRLALTMRGVALPAATTKARQLLEEVGLGPRLGLRPGLLSTGECQRVAVARALADEPTVLFADEPTAALDTASGQAVIRLLTRLVQDQGATLVVVTHDPRILPFADRILHLEDGRLTRTLDPVALRGRARALGELVPEQDKEEEYAS
jgi:putative ABC transport system ATP-binding protein